MSCRHAFTVPRIDLKLGRWDGLRSAPKDKVKGHGDLKVKVVTATCCNFCNFATVPIPLALSRVVARNFPYRTFVLNGHKPFGHFGNL